jgi:hypothetical protein
MMVVMPSLIVMGLVRWAVKLTQWLIVVWLITACGRIGFDSEGGEGGAEDGAGAGVDSGTGGTGSGNSNDDSGVGEASNPHYIIGGTEVGRLSRHRSDVADRPRHQQQRYRDDRGLGRVVTDA